MELAKKGLEHLADQTDVIAGRMERDETFAERRQNEAWDAADGLGPMPPGNSADLMTALGHWADWDDSELNEHGASRIERQQAGQPEDITDKRLAINEVHNHYMVQNEGDFDKLDKMLPPEDTTLDLSSPEARVRSLDNLVQNKAGDKDAESTCAASSLLGGALLAGGKKGTEGLETLMNAMDQNADENTRKMLDSGDLGDIRAKLKKGEQLSVEDMHKLQRDLYQQLDNKESNDHFDTNKPGIESDTMKQFIKNSPELAKMMADNKMDISFIQNNPDIKTSGHAVLSIGGGSAVYDPELRDDGQIVTNADELANYKKAEHEHVL